MISVSPEKLVVKEGDAAEFSCSVEAGRPAPEVIFFLTRHFICVILVFFLAFLLSYHHDLVPTIKPERSLSAVWSACQITAEIRVLVFIAPLIAVV